MRVSSLLMGGLWCLATGSSWAWSNHSLVTYRALENMPEVANAAPVTVEAQSNQ